MADSRFAARRLFKQKWSISLKAAQFIGVSLIAYFLTEFIADETFSDTAWYTLLLLFLSIGLWVTEAIPPFAVAIFIMGYLIYALGSEFFNSEPIDPTKYVQTLSSPIIWLLLGGFFLAQGMQKTRLDLSIFQMAAKMFGAEPKRMLLGLMLTTMFSSMIMSNTAATAMMIASVIPFINSLEKNAPISKAILIGIPAAATLGGMGTIIGSPPNAVAVALLEDRGMAVSFISWMIYGLAPAALLTTFFWYVLSRVYKPKIEKLEIDTKADDEAETNPADRRRVLTITILTVVLWLSTPLHNIPVAAIAFVPIVFLPIIGIVKANDFNSLPWDTLILVAGGLSLGMALEDAGLIERLVAVMDISDLPHMAVMLLFGWICVLLSNVMSNTAAATVLLPVAITIMPDHAIEIATVVALSASCALFLPVSTPPNAIAFGTGHLEQKDFRLGGLIIGITGPVVAVLWASVIGLLIGTI